MIVFEPLPPRVNRIIVTHPIIKLLLTVVVILISTSAPAVEVENLYRGKILVTDKTQKTRVKAHRWAIEQVLTKVTGSRDILEDKTVQYEIRVRTANYIKSFSFVTDEQDRTFLVDEFDQTKIDQLIRKVNGAIWGQRRPLTSIWLVLEEGNRRQIVTQDNFPQLAEVLNQSAENRGVPVVIPTMDKQRQERIYVSDVWARFDRVVAKESQQLGAEHFVMARLRYVDSLNEPEYKTGWLLDYQLFSSNQFLNEGSFNTDQFTSLRELINSLGDYFAKQYAIDNAQVQQDEVVLTISGINSMLDLKRVETQVNSLPPVKKSYLSAYKSGQITFKLWLSGQTLDVIKALELLPNFNQLENPVKEVQPNLSVEERLDRLTNEYIGNLDDQANKAETKNTILHYQWVGA